jgi:3-oxoacyl-[acyl-carrier protein] reductase
VNRVIVDLTGRVALVTGAAGGLGQGIVEALLDGGATVVATDLPSDALTTLTARFAGDPRVLTTPLDVRLRGAALGSVLSEIRRVTGPPDILVNNAAIFPSTDWRQIPDDQWDRVLDVNVSAGFRLVRALAGDLAASTAGRVVNISSITFHVGITRLLHYVTSKGAVVGFTRALARELGPQAVTVNAVLPGAFPTAAEAVHPDPAGYEAHVLAHQCLQRRGRPRDIGNAVAFLGSDAASFITGQTVVVDGGWVLG